MLKELESEGLLGRRRGSTRDAEKLPPVTVLQIMAPDRDGDVFAAPVDWQGRGPAPRILFAPREGEPAPGAGERILARLVETGGEDHQYQARLIRRIGTAAHKIVGIFRKEAEGGRILPIDKGPVSYTHLRAHET